MILTKTPCKYLNILLACLAFIATSSLCVQGAQLKNENAKPSSTIILRGEVDIVGSALRAVGITISSTKLPSIITSVRLGSPAYYANLESQDKIVSAQIDGGKISLTIERNGNVYSTQLFSEPAKSIAQIPLQNLSATKNLMSSQIGYNQLPVLDQARTAEIKINIPEPVFPLRAEVFSTPDGRQGWVLKFSGGYPIETPTYSGGLLFVSGDRNMFCAINAKNGRCVWQMNTESIDVGPSSAVVDGKFCAFNTGSCTVYVVDTIGGNPVWQRYVSDVLLTQPSEANGLLYTAYPWLCRKRYDKINDQPGIICFKLATGAQLWYTSLPHEVISAPIIENGRVYATCADGSTNCLDAQTGQILWTKLTGGLCAPLVLNGHVFHTSGEWSTQAALAAKSGYDSGRPAYAKGLIIQVVGRTVEAIDPLSRMTRWRTLLNYRRQLSQNEAISNSPQYRVGAVSMEAIRRAEIDLLKQLNSFICYSPAIGQQNIYLTTKEGYIISLRLADGKVNFCYDTRQSLSSSPCLANGYLYVSASGKLICLYIGPDADGWTCWGGNAQHNKID